MAIARPSNYDDKTESPPTTDGNSSQDAYYGSVFGDRMLGYKVAQANGTIAISFLRLPVQSAGTISYFQVYTGVEAANSLTMTGTFRVYTGSLTTNGYTYAVQSPVYAWSATLQKADDLTILWPSAYEFVAAWSINANSYLGTLGLWVNFPDGNDGGVAFTDGMIGVLPLVSCSTLCSGYFIRATTSNLSAFQIYNGGSVGKTLVGRFVEGSQWDVRTEL